MALKGQSLTIWLKGDGAEPFRVIGSEAKSCDLEGGKTEPCTLVEHGRAEACTGASCGMEAGRPQSCGFEAGRPES